MIAGVIPLGVRDGENRHRRAAGRASSGIVVDGWSPFAVLLVLFWTAALVTQILSDAATTVLLGPIALAMAVWR